ncbi:Group 2 truncated hemoglobin YjbI [BD1-7 clade bacterium]|uniref:Group 2 truncated hemoglobin YjbI n=1 Tax=BD1-7 clade bacterium TaxID=2029982 RepID=A0A5S9QRR8_9GAMM|nr:Group 2 truncated hemoglobin YjbI [BD1-7 clade bacterium]CAA0121947.1 Group 2 truncated hemoglobin YjbI [BD1-7 clade bacterium]CAA0124644.1 Group 2 truncated hemoglobin YjbI [BD1-7 clade bacterium]
MSQKTPYELMGKEEGIRAFAAAFYDAMDELPEAEHVRKMHAQSLTDIKEKLFEYLNGWFGGPHLYQEKYGSICLTDPHKPYKISESARDEWLLCWDKALDTVGASDELRTMLKDPIFRMADFMVNDREDTKAS